MTGGGTGMIVRQETGDEEEEREALLHMEGMGMMETATMRGEGEVMEGGDGRGWMVWEEGGVLGMLGGGRGARDDGRGWVVWEEGGVLGMMGEGG